MSFNIKQIRKQKRMTQEELSKKSGVSRSIIGGLESGRCTVTTTSTLRKLADALDVNVENFFEQNG